MFSRLFLVILFGVNHKTKNSVWTAQACTESICAFPGGRRCSWLSLRFSRPFSVWRDVRTLSRFLGIVGEGATEEWDGQTRSLHTSSRSSARELRVIASIAHRDARLERVIDLLEPAETLQVGSVGYKVGKIVSDEADLYVATTNRISLWDTCAPEAILHSAGGLFLNVDGDPLNYAGPGLTHERGLLATNGAATNDVVSRLAGVLPDLS